MKESAVNRDFSEPDERPIVKANHLLAMEIDNISDMVHTLEDRISSILYNGPAAVNDKTVEKGESSSTSTLAGFIQGQTERVRQTRFHLAGLIDRLEL